MKIEYNNGDIQNVMLQIRHIMLDKNIRQKDICNKTGWSRQTVSNLLACRRDGITLDTLLMLCKACGCSLYLDIVSEDQDRPEETPE
jgi:DNA-binding Xre family transcriptional regulator